MPTDPADPKVRYFATGHFREGRGYGADRPRGVHDWLLIYTARGRGWVTHAEGDFHVGPGEALLFAPRRMHGYFTASEPGVWELLFAHFDPPPTWTELLRWPEWGPGVMGVRLRRGRLRRRVASALLDADRLARTAMPLREPKVLNRIEAALLWCKHAVEEETGPVLDDRIREALDYIQRHLDHPIDVATLSRAVNLSPSRFAHLFREQTGQSPLRAVEAHRVRYAQQLLVHTDLPISEVARRCGFEDAFYFSRRFRRAAGQSPSELREDARR